VCGVGELRSMADSDIQAALPGSQPLAGSITSASLDSINEQALSEPSGQQPKVCIPILILHCFDATCLRL
jgi:hypothetical protein